MQRINTLRRQFNWRMLLMRIVVNALALLITALLIPKIEIVQHTLRNLLFLAVFLGVLNAVVKPIIQFATLRFIFATYGLVVALINAVVLILLEALFPDRFAVGGIFWPLVAGALIGLLSAFLENLFGMTPPIVSEKYPEVRRKIKERETWSVEARVAESAAKVMLPSEPTEQPDTPAGAAVPAVVGEGDADPTPPSLTAPPAESTAMEPPGEVETRPPAAQDAPGPSPDSPAPAHTEG